MSEQTRYLLDLYREADAFVLRTYSGTVCPCWAWHGTGYSKDWHRTGNPGAAVADCGGTGILVAGRVTTDTNLKARLIPTSNAATALQERDLPEEYRTAIGNIKEETLYLIGTINIAQSESTQLPVFYSLLNVVEHQSEIRYDSKVYKVRKVDPIYNVAEQALLVRHE